MSSVELKHYVDEDMQANCVSVSYWNDEEAPEAIALLLSEARKKWGSGRKLDIIGSTPSDRGFINPHSLIAMKGQGR